MAGTNLFTAISATCWIALTEEGKTSSSQLAMFAKCVGTPPTTANVFEHGCLITQTDSGTGNPALYENTGSSAVPSWTLVAAPAPGTISLTNTHILVGNVSNVAADVALSGDATLANTGAMTIANNAITTAKILAANVTLAKLAAGITPSSIVKFDGKASNGGGSATVTITATGVLSTDRVFAQVEASTNAVTVQKVTPTADTVTVLLSGDPGAATVISWMALRTAA